MKCQWEQSVVFITVGAISWPMAELKFESNEFGILFQKVFAVQSKLKEKPKEKPPDNGLFI